MANGNKRSKKEKEDIIVEINICMFGYFSQQNQGISGKYDSNFPINYYHQQLSSTLSTTHILIINIARQLHRHKNAFLVKHMLQSFGTVGGLEKDRFVKVGLQKGRLYKDSWKFRTAFSRPFVFRCRPSARKNLAIGSLLSIQKFR